MTLTLTDFGPPLDETALLQFEDLYDLQIPIQYRRFLLRWNGGVPDRKRFTTSNGKVETGIRQFLPLRLLQDRFSVERELWLLERDEYIDGLLLPFAIDFRTSRMLIGLEGDSLGAIFYNPLDESVHDDNREQQLVHVSNSLDEFVEMLK